MGTALIPAKSRAISTALMMLLAAASPLSLVWLLYYVRLLYLPWALASTVAVMGWCLFAMLMVVFPLWLHDASTRVARTSLLPLPFSRVDAAVAFFVPVRHTLMPYSVMRSLLFRATRQLSTEALVKTWSASWLALLSGAGIYVLYSLHLIRVGYDLITIAIYGPAAVFCFLSLLLVMRFENGLKSGGH
jgi:hypothetical protein